MDIRKSHHVENGEPDEQGLFDYYYEYDIYEFRENGVCYVARSYTDEPQEAHFLRKESEGSAAHLTEDDLENPLFRRAAQELKKEGKKEVRYFHFESGRYLSIENNT